MPSLIPSRKFLEDAEAFRRDAVLRKKLAITVRLPEMNPLCPGLHPERIVNDPTAWSVRIDQRYRLSFDPGAYSLPEALTGRPQSHCCASSTITISTIAPDRS